MRSRNSAAYAGELAALGLNLLRQEKGTEAEPLLRECLTIRDKIEPDDWRTFNTKSMLGAALLGQKKYADAERRSHERKPLFVFNRSPNRPVRERRFRG